MCYVEVTWTNRVSSTLTTASVTPRWHAMKVKKHLRSKWCVEVQTFRRGDDDGRQIRILRRILTWETYGIEYEADQTHAAVLLNRS